MNARATAKAILIASVVFLGLIAGATARAALATSEDQLLHLVVEQTSRLDAKPRVIEYWLDEQRVLAKSVEATALGAHSNATGPNWFLQVPPRGRAQYLETAVASGPARSVWASLFYLRDSLPAGAARLVAGDQSLVVVQIGRRMGAFEPTSGLPIWDTVDGTRIDYVYRVREQLAARAFPTSFFLDTQGREVTSTYETMSQRVAQLVTFPTHPAPQAIAGRRLEKTFVTLNPSEFTREQVTYIYGDLTVTVSLLAKGPTFVRAGGTAISSELGPGWLFDNAGRSQLMVLDRTIAINVHAPDAQAALAASAALAAGR